MIYFNLRNDFALLLLAPFLIGSLIGLSGCSSSRQVSAPQTIAASSSMNSTMSTMSPVMSPVIGQNDSAKENIPSAALDTPLCGAALHERAAADAKIYAGALQSGSSCAFNACFQPLTGTYLSQDGTNTVCR